MSIASEESFGSTGLVLYNWDPATQLTNFIAAQAAVTAGTPGASAIIATFGDSTTEGINADGQDNSGNLAGSYPAVLTADLGTDTGFTSQDANFQGEDVDAGTLTYIGPNFNNGNSHQGLEMAGGDAIQTSEAGQGFVYSLTNAGTFDQLVVSYFDGGSGDAEVTVEGGPQGSVTKELSFGNSGDVLSQTISLPVGVYTSVTLTANSANPTYIEGVSFSDTDASAYQVYNFGEGGAWSNSASQPEFPDGLALHPSLALLDYGINDILDNNFTPEQTVANYQTMIQECRAANCDPIILLPNPFGLNPYLPPPLITSFAAVRAGLQALAVQENVPIIDLSATYGDSVSGLENAGLLDSPHPTAALYADIASRIAALLSGTQQTSFVNTASYVVTQTQTVTGTSGHDLLFGASTQNILVGNGGDDTYVWNANDVSDTIVNGTGAGGADGQLDITAYGHDQLWFEQSGNNLVIDVLGTGQQATIEDWFAGNGSGLQAIMADDGTELTSNVDVLVQAMASFAAENPGFDPSSTSDGNLTDAYYGAALANAVAADWGAADPPAGQLGGGEPACFHAGTRLRTPEGMVAVEDLAIGDFVTTLHAGAQRIKWIGWRNYAGVWVKGREDVLPICISRDALAPGLPGRDLYVSPGHAIYVRGRLTHAARLVNGGSIFQLRDAGDIRYYHIELEQHEIVFAEGCPAESFLDQGSRRQFQNAYECNGERAPGWPCIERVEQGFAMAAMRGGDPKASGRSDLYGKVEQMGPQVCSGWVRSASQPNAPVCVDILSQGRRVARALANQFRPDVRDAGFGNAECGFEVRLPAGLTSGIEVRGAVTGAALGPWARKLAA